MRRRVTARRMGGSIGATLPKEMVDRLHIEGGDELTVIETEEGLLNPVRSRVRGGDGGLRARRPDVPERAPRARRLVTREGGDEPAWLCRLAVETIHRDLIRQPGGSFGLRDEGRLEAALARPRNRWTYGEDPDRADLAAACAHGVARSPPFVDGNERVALMAAYVFLAMNDRDLDAPEPEAVAMVVALAKGDASEEEFADWVRQHLR